MSERKDRDDPVIAELKRLGAIQFNITLADGTERKAQLATKGNRWDRLSKLLGSIDWHVIEAMDKDGKLLGRIDSPDDEAFADIPDDGSGSVDIVALSKVMLEVMRSTQRETRLMFQVQMEGQAALVSAMMEAMKAASDSYSLALKVQSTVQLGNAADGGSPEVMEMMKMAMMMSSMGGIGGKPPINVPTGGK